MVENSQVKEVIVSDSECPAWRKKWATRGGGWGWGWGGSRCCTLLLSGAEDTGTSFPFSTSIPRKWLWVWIRQTGRVTHSTSLLLPLEFSLPVQSQGWLAHGRRWIWPGSLEKAVEGERSDHTKGPHLQHHSKIRGCLPRLCFSSPKHKGKSSTYGGVSPPSIRIGAEGADGEKPVFINSIW